MKNVTLENKKYKNYKVYQVNNQFINNHKLL